MTRPEGRLPRRRHRRPGSRRLVAAGAALAAVLGVVLAACGATPSPSPAPSADPSGTASPGAVTPGPGASTDPAATPFPPGAFTVELPDGWRSVPVDGDHGALASEFAATSPAFAESLEARLENLPDTATYVAFDGSEEAVAAGELATLTVTEVDLPPDVTLETFARTVQTQVEQLVEGDVELRRILVTAGQAYSLAYLAPLTRPDGEPGAAAVTQVLYVLPGRGYVLTFAVPPERANDYAQAIADTATSFTITP